jgi:hypothetical protein
LFSASAGNPFKMNPETAAMFLLCVERQEGGPNTNPQVARFADLKNKTKAAVVEASVLERIDKYAQKALSALESDSKAGASGKGGEKKKTKPPPGPPPAKRLQVPLVGGENICFKKRKTKK